MCVGLPLEASLAGESTGCEGADREHDCPEQTPACSCQSASASSQHDVVSSDYRFVYLGCKVGRTPSRAMHIKLEVDTLASCAVHGANPHPVYSPVASCHCFARNTTFYRQAVTTGFECKPSKWTPMLPPQPLFPTTEAYTHGTLVVYCCPLAAINHRLPTGHVLQSFSHALK